MREDQQKGRTRRIRCGCQCGTEGRKPRGEEGGEDKRATIIAVDRPGSIDRGPQACCGEV